MIDIKNLFVVLLCLTPTALLSWNLYFNRNCLNEAGAKSIFDEAFDLESHGELKQAHNKYKIVDAYSCENYDVRAKAVERALAVQVILDKKR
ncbi:MAG: hypothetical protein EOO52_01715 [Gammaproteobacteria bacterium]|nr:MAG: hypothetical protein EOO52_01715 [Gammaproteobacteria bacterium]